MAESGHSAHQKALPDFCRTPVCVNVLQRAYRAVGALPNAFTINTLELKHRLREAGAGGSNPLTPTRFPYSYQTRRAASLSNVFLSHLPWPGVSSLTRGHFPYAVNHGKTE